MQANELRIGNYVYVDWVDAGRKLETNYGVHYGNDAMVMDVTPTGYGVGISFVEPIPLTEEWLVKFGFEKRESSTCSEYHIGVNEITHDWLFSITWLKEPETINAPNAPFYRNGRHVLYYVHQLQNLYFALTGEELTISVP